jgi:hypothetical protein
VELRDAIQRIAVSFPLWSASNHGGAEATAGNQAVVYRILREITAVSAEAKFVVTRFWTRVDDLPKPSQGSGAKRIDQLWVADLTGAGWNWSLSTWR